MAPILNKQRARSNEDTDPRRQELLDAAARLLADSTYENVTVAAVAEAAGIVRPSAYGYFGSKETLFLAFTEREPIELKAMRNSRPRASISGTNWKSLWSD